MPIEINLSLAGAETWSMIKASYDVDLIREYCKVMLGLKVNEAFLKFNRNSPRYRCISKDFHPAKNVFINSVGRSVGDKLNIKDYLGWVVVKSDFKTSQQALQLKLEEVLGYINIELIEY